MKPAYDALMLQYSTSETALVVCHVGAQMVTVPSIRDTNLADQSVRRATPVGRGRLHGRGTEYLREVRGAVVSEHQVGQRGVWYAGLHRSQKFIRSAGKSRVGATAEPSTFSAFREPLTFQRLPPAAVDRHSPRRT